MQTNKITTILFDSFCIKNEMLTEMHHWLLSKISLHDTITIQNEKIVYKK